MPVLLALILLAGGGVFLLHRNDQQARDTIRKHHLADLEDSLYFARSLHGTYPPYDQSSWCGVLNQHTDSATFKEVEEALRLQNEKYKNIAKPFPSDPRYADAAQDYFYWKHSPASFELFSILEQDNNGNKSVGACPEEKSRTYDYGLTSVWREN